MNSAAAKATSRGSRNKDTSIPWRERPRVTLTLAHEVSGISPASLYRAAKEGRLTLVRLEGRVLVETRSLLELMSTAQSWTPSDRGKAARQKRAETARANWRR